MSIVTNLGKMLHLYIAFDKLKILIHVFMFSQTLQHISTVYNYMYFKFEYLLAKCAG